MNKRSMWYFGIMFSTFIILNTFIFDTPVKEKKSESIVDLTTEHLPLSELKNSMGHTICSSLAFNDLLITISSDNLPKSLLKNDEKVHLIKKTSNGINIYSDKISPNLKDPANLEDNENFLVVTNLSSNEPKVFAANYKNGTVDFLFDTPEKSGLAVSESKDGLNFVGLWNADSKQIEAATELDGVKDLVARASLSNTMNRPEKLYCLENDQMQVVFSTAGGAISEFNLKLYSKEDPTSVIKPVSLDKKIAKESPQNNKFPLKPTLIAGKSGNPVAMKSVEGGYTPLLRRDIVDSEGKTIFKVPPKHYACALRADKNQTYSNFQMTRLTATSIQFKGVMNGKEVIRTYRLVKDAPYTLEVKNSVNGSIANLAMTSGILEVEKDGGAGASLLYYNYTGNKMKLQSFKLPKEVETIDNISPSWTANTNGFFAGILHSKGRNPHKVTTMKIEGNEAPSRVSLVDVDMALNPSHKFAGYEILTPIESGTVLSSYNFYVGPLDKNVLSQVDLTLANNETGANPEFVKAITVRGWLTFISDPFARFMNVILDFFYMITKSWGFSIILLTITLHILLYPFSAKAFKSMIKMKKIAPKQKEIEARYKNDPQRLRMELMLLYKNEGVNPIAGILPMFLQIPFFIGMFDLLKTKFALRGAVFIPGWITNLTAPDVVFSWGFNIPFIGNEFHLLPILGALAMHYSQKFMTNLQGPKKNPTDMEKQMQSMGPILTLVFLFIFYNLASGLNIYLLVSSLLRMAQQWYMTKKYSDDSGKVTVMKG